MTLSSEMDQAAEGELTADLETERELIEPLIPRWAVWFYVLSPPFISLLLHPQLVEMDSGRLTRTLLATWIHTVSAGASLHALYAWVVPRVIKDIRRPALRLALHGVAILLGLSGGIAVSAPLAYLACDWGPRRPWWELYTSFLIASCFVLALVSYTRMRYRARDVERRALRSQQAALEARLASLTARTNPHFLFNSLNTVAGLIGEDPARAEEAVERLADLFRYTLDASRRTRVELFKEMEAVESYLEIEGLRFEDKLRFEVMVDVSAHNLKVPPLAVQPLVENAVRHGIESRGMGRVDVSARRQGDKLVVQIEDDGLGPGRSEHVGSRTSMDDLRQRLRLIYRDGATLTVAERAEGGCAVTLQLPADE